MTPATEQPTSAQPSFALSAVLERVKQAVAGAFDTAQIWVEVEIDAIKRHPQSGHMSLELVEREDEQANVSVKKSAFKARANAVIWRSNISIVQAFERATKVRLEAGLKVMICVAPRFDERYGLSLIVQAINHDYGIGSLVILQQRIVDELTEKGLFTRQKQLAAPFDYHHIAVISPQDAAGLGDFKSALSELTIAGVLNVDYFHASFEGDNVLDSFKQAFRAVYDQHASRPFDALIIVRGGGATSGLKQLTDLTIAHSICVMPMPVYTGIGHERDHCILDEVAHTRFDTPTAVAAHIKQKAKHNAQRLEQLFTNIQTQSLRRLDRIQSRLVQLQQHRQRLSLQHLVRIHQKLMNTWQPVAAYALKQLKIQDKKLNQGVQQIRQHVQSKLTEYQRQLVQQGFHQQVLAAIHQEQSALDSLWQRIEGGRAAQQFRRAQSRKYRLYLVILAAIVFGLVGVVIFLLQLRG